MTFRAPLFVGASGGGTGTDGVKPQDARLALSALAPGTGVLSGCTVAGTTGTNMTYTIAAGAVALARGNISVDGVYISPNDGTVTVNSGSPAPASGSRYDLIFVAPRNAYDGGFGDSTSLPNVGVVVGTSGSTPAKPYASVPAGGLVLAESLVQSGATSAADGAHVTITQVGAWAPGIMERQVADWNQATAPGFYFGVVTTTLNAPDTNNGFSGVVFTNTSGSVIVQTVWRMDSSGQEWTRSFTSGAWNPWRLIIGADLGGGGNPVNNVFASVSPGTLSTEVFARVGWVCTFYIEFTLSSAITVPSNGDVGNTPVATVTALHQPRITTPLSSGNIGPVLSGVLLPSGSVNITATAPGVTLGTGTTYSLGGTYLALNAN